jgi:acyl-coenzyme A synthetase/AMP-(fatty) acid ligase
MSASLLSAWRRTVAAAPDAVALIDAAGERRWTRVELDHASDAWNREHGAALRRHTVAFAEPNGSGWLVVFLGLLKAGAVALPLDPGEPAAAHRALAAALRVRALWLGNALEPTTHPARPARDDRRLVKLTSGSTGAPRPLAFADAPMLADGRHICAGMAIRAGDLNLGLIPWGHSYGLGNLVMPLLLQGTAILFGVAPLPHAIAAAVRRFRPTIFPAVPALLQALASSDIAAADFASLRTVISAGAPLRAGAAQAFADRFARPVHNFYGSSETGGITYDRTGESAALGRGVGRPLPGVSISLDRGGRIRVESDAVLVIGNRTPGSLRMADVGEIAADGELRLLRRAGRFVKIAGRRLNLAEIEHALKQLPGVKDAFVAPHPSRADALAAAVVATGVSATTLQTRLRERMASWKVPKKIAVLPAFPLNARGKTDTRALQALLGG